MREPNEHRDPPSGEESEVEIISDAVIDDAGRSELRQR